MQRYGFISGIIIVLILAACFPTGGAGPGYLFPNVISKTGVCLIFFLQGLSLRPDEIRDGAMNWKVHCWTQLFIFGLAPLWAWILLKTFGSSWSPNIAIGFIYLSLLPTTITSAVAFVISSSGNVPAAIFNTSLSNVLGVFITPVLTIKALGALGAATPPLSPLLIKISLMLLLPLIIGQLARPWLAELIKRHRANVKKLTTGIVFFILYTAFCDSFLKKTWNALQPTDMARVFGTTCLFLVLQTGSVWWITQQRWIGMNQADRICAIFCGSQKTLAAGAPMAAFIFSTADGNDIALSLVLLPLVIFHSCQLILAALLVPKLAIQEDVN